jgi:hypothetical protein
VVQVVVGIDTLMGSERPGELVGHGPIDADTARALAADSVIERLLTDPATGTVLEHGRTRYAPPAALADHIRSRDQICRGPRCTRRVRDVPGWQSVTDPDDPNGDVIWISPCGRRTVSSPYDYRDFTDDLATRDDPPPATATLEPAPTGTETGRSPDEAVEDPPPF